MYKAYKIDILISPIINSKTLLPKCKEPEHNEHIPELNLEKEDSLWNSKINQILANLTLEIENLCIRITSYESDNILEAGAISTLLFRVRKLSLKPWKSPKETDDKAGLLLSNKRITVSLIQLFILDFPIIRSNEYTLRPQVTKLEFPFEYPTSFHPSCVLQCGSENGDDSLNIEANYSEKKIISYVPVIHIIATVAQIKTLAVMLEYWISIINALTTIVANPNANSDGFALDIRIVISKACMDIPVKSIPYFYREFDDSINEKCPCIPTDFLRVKLENLSVDVKCVKADVNLSGELNKLEISMCSYFKKSDMPTTSISSSVLYNTALEESALAKEADFITKGKYMLPKNYHPCNETIFTLKLKYIVSITPLNKLALGKWKTEIELPISQVEFKIQVVNCKLCITTRQVLTLLSIPLSMDTASKQMAAAISKEKIAYIPVILIPKLVYIKSSTILMDDCELAYYHLLDDCICSKNKALELVGSLSLNCELNENYEIDEYNDKYIKWVSSKYALTIKKLEIKDVLQIPEASIEVLLKRRDIRSNVANDDMFKLMQSVDMEFNEALEEDLDSKHTASSYKEKRDRILSMSVPIEEMEKTDLAISLKMPSINCNLTTDLVHKLTDIFSIVCKTEMPSIESLQKELSVQSIIGSADQQEIQTIAFYIDISTLKLSIKLMSNVTNNQKLNLIDNYDPTQKQTVYYSYDEGSNVEFGFKLAMSDIHLEMCKELANSNIFLSVRDICATAMSDFITIIPSSNSSMAQALDQYNLIYKSKDPKIAQRSMLQVSISISHEIKASVILSDMIVKCDLFPGIFKFVNALMPVEQPHKEKEELPNSNIDFKVFVNSIAFVVNPKCLIKKYTNEDSKITKYEYSISKSSIIIKSGEGEGILLYCTKTGNDLSMSLLLSFVHGYIWQPSTDADYHQDNSINTTDSSTNFNLKNLKCDINNSKISVEIEHIYVGLCKDSINEIIRIIHSLQAMLSSENTVKPKQQAILKPKSWLSSDLNIVDNYFEEKLTEEIKESDFSVRKPLEEEYFNELENKPDMEFKMNEEYIPLQSHSKSSLNPIHDLKEKEVLEHSISASLSTLDFYFYDGSDINNKRNKSKCILFKINKLEFVRNKIVGPMPERYTLFINSVSISECITSNDLKLIFSKIEKTTNIPILTMKIEKQNGMLDIELTPQSMSVSIDYAIIKFIMAFLTDLDLGQQGSEPEDDNEDETMLFHAVIKHFIIKVNFSLIMNEIKNMMIVFKKYEYRNCLLNDFVINAMKFYAMDIKKYLVLKGIKCIILNSVFLAQAIY